jgi:hypothetical protein
MIHVFYNKRGSGKTKALIDMANEKAEHLVGNMVYIDDDKRPILQLDRRIRFIATEEYRIKEYSHFYGFLCGILAEDYDIDTIFIDGLFNIVHGTPQDAAHLFFDLERLAETYNIEFYINVNDEEGVLPDYMKKYVA